MIETPNIQTGQIIKATVNRFPLITHYGIVLLIDGVQHIMHHSPGTGIFHITSQKMPEVETLDSYLNKHTVVSVSDSVLMGYTVNEILERQKQICNTTYNVFFQNCEHFISCMLTGSNGISLQVIKWGVAAIILKKYFINR